MYRRKSTKWKKKIIFKTRMILSKKLRQYSVTRARQQIPNRRLKYSSKEKSILQIS